MQQTVLEPKKELLNPLFDGYKLSLDSVPIHEVALPSEVQRIYPNDDQYSFLHLRSFSLHNYLHQDPWNSQFVYFVIKSEEVVCSTFEKFTGHLSGVAKVFQLSNSSPSEIFANQSLSFPSQELALLSDGHKSLCLLKTGSRESSSQSWNVLFEGVVSEEPGFSILDSKFCPQEKSLMCILLSVVDGKSMDLKTVPSSEDASKFVSFLNVIALVVDDSQTWSVKSKKQLYCSGEIEYCSLDKTLSSLSVISKEPLIFLFDSENPVLEGEPNQDSKQNGEKKVEYYWQQTTNDVSVWLKVPRDTSRTQISVAVDGSELLVKYQEKIVLQGVLHHNIVENLTTWIIDDDKLEIILFKREGLVWPWILKDNSSGEEIVDPAFASEIHERLAHLCSDTEVKAKDLGSMCAPAFNMEQLEDCDAFDSDSKLLSRIDLLSHLTTHQVHLGGTQWLFNCTISPDESQSFCLRHDVDGCVWVPKADSDSNWRYEHVATFLALGYVQASKQQKKFITCPPDFSYAAIIETNRHVYLYKQTCSVNSELRNRKSGSKIGTVAKQQLINLPSNEEVLGVQATNSSLFILTAAHLYCLDVA